MRFEPSSYISKSLLFCCILIAFARCSTSLSDDVTVAMETLPEQIDYNYHVKPILADRCYACHGPDENTRKAGLRLDVEQEAYASLASGNHAIIPSKPYQSSLIHRILSEDSEIIMPPPDSKLTLSAEEKAVLI